MKNFTSTVRKPVPTTFHHLTSLCDFNLSLLASLPCNFTDFFQSTRVLIIDSVFLIFISLTSVQSLFFSFFLYFIQIALLLFIVSINILLVFYSPPIPIIQCKVIYYRTHIVCYFSRLLDLIKP